MPGNRTNVFVSYSHSDASLVAPVVKLLRLNRSLVFHDVDAIQPGTKWRDAIERGLTDAQLVIVFWCDHARCSEEVAKEWKAALAQGKDLLPLLLDASPLPPELSEFQWIDFRATVGASHTAVSAAPAPGYSAPPSPAAGAPPVIDVSPPQPSPAATPSPWPDVRRPTVGAPPSRSKPSAPAKSYRWLSWGGLAALIAVVAVSSLLTLNSPHLPAPINPAHDPSKPTPPGVSDRFFSEGILLWLAVLLVVAGGLVWLWRRRSRRDEQANKTSAHHSEIERRIAREIEVEILRRASPRRDASR